jgi:metal-sulfur cluster biosynthetic enzyme
MHIVERIRFADADTLAVELTITAPSCGRAELSTE